MNHEDQYNKQFVSEVIFPVDSSFLTELMSSGEPDIPMRFRWRDTEYEVVRVLEKWKTTGDCRHGSGEKYVRKHWYRVETADGKMMQIYFDRQPRVKDVHKRWWLMSIWTRKDEL